MKDALGHGSNAGFGRKSVPAFGRRDAANRSGDLSDRGDSAGRTVYRDDTSNAEAAQSLMSALRSTQAPIHPAMQNRSDRAAAGPSPYLNGQGRSVMPRRPFRQSDDQ